MKSLHLTTLLVALAAATLSLYSHYQLSQKVVVQVATEPKALVMKILNKARWDGTDAFFTKNRVELVSNLELANFLENKGVGIAFVRTVGGNKKLQWCVWMRKTEVGWEHVPYLGPRYSNPFLQEWIIKNNEWLSEMDSKKEKWEADTECLW